MKTSNLMSLTHSNIAVSLYHIYACPFTSQTIIIWNVTEIIRVWDPTLLTLLSSTAYTTWGLVGRKRRLSAARRNAWAGGMLYRVSVSLTPLIQGFRGRPLALRPLNLVLYACWAGWWIGSLVRCPNHLTLCCWIRWWMLFPPTISLILVLGIMSLLVLLTAFLKHLILQVVILHSRGLVMVMRPNILTKLPFPLVTSNP